MRLLALLRQIIKYFGAALVGYGVDFGTLVLLTEVFHIHYLISATAGFILGLIVVYIISNKFVFGESKIKSRTNEFLLFGLVGLVGLLLLNFLMWSLTSAMHVNYIISKLLATVVVYAWNFFARRALYHD